MGRRHDERTVRGAAPIPTIAARVRFVKPFQPATAPETFRRPAAPALLLAGAWLLAAAAGRADDGPPAPAAPSTQTAAEAAGPALKLGVADAVTVQVYGRPELTTTTYVADDGSITVPLAGKVAVLGMPPAQAAQQVAAALREGQYLVNPQVTIVLVQYRSQQVSVLGEVRTPARFPIESRTTVFDLLAQAGGITEQGASTAYLLRPDAAGRVERIAIDLKGLTEAGAAIPTVTLRGGDALFVPRAGQFYVYGEVQSPNMYRLEPGMTVMQAISRSGGLTPRGSGSRLEIRRRGADGKYRILEPELTDPLNPDDVLRVKERIF